MKFIKKHPILIIFWIVVLSYIFWNYLRPVTIYEKIDKDAVQYVNDLYYSDGMAYEKLLNDNEKKLYMTMLRDINKNRVETKFEGPEFECDVFYPEGEMGCTKLVEKVLEAILLDHPELVQWGAYSQIQIGEFQRIDYRYDIRSNALTLIHTARMQRIVEDVRKKTKNMNTIEKVKYVYDWIGARSELDYKLTIAAKNQSAWDIFNKKTSTSAGFAKASQILFQNIGVESYLVIGNTTGPHMWNIIKVNDKYYYFDSTNAASITKDSNNYYSGIGANVKSYELSHPDIYPEINGDEKLIN